jgi:hypothetical protein
VLRRRDPERDRPFRVPWSVRGIPLLPAIGAASIAVLLTQLEGVALLCGGTLIALTLVVDALVRRRRE